MLLIVPTSIHTEATVLAGLTLARSIPWVDPIQPEPGPIANPVQSQLTIWGFKICFSAN